MAARHRAAPVFGGLALGYALTNLLSVIVGSAVGAALPERAASIIGGLFFKLRRVDVSVGRRDG
jgi:putative Ca2+/H+ antiporter (TMEM165/GDT1 family)